MKTAHKLALAIVTLVASALLLRINSWFGLGFVVALPLAILWWFDLGHELRFSAASSRFARAVGLVMGLPQALFGLVSLVAGISIIVWVVYNSFWRRSPDYIGGFLTFGIGPILVLFGTGLVANAFRRPRDRA